MEVKIRVPTRITLLLLSFLLSFLLIFLVLGGNSLQAAEGSLESSSDQLSEIISVTLDVEKYAAISYDRDPIDDGLDFLEVEGSTGIYHTTNGDSWKNHLIDIWGEKWETHPIPDQNGKRQGIVVLDVATNTEINIDFEFVKGDNWIESETLFSLWNAPGGYDSNTFGEHEDYTATTNFQQDSSTSKEYHLVGGFLIEDITQQEAGDYNAEIHLTVSSVD